MGSSQPLPGIQPPIENLDGAQSEAHRSRIDVGDGKNIGKPQNGTTRVFLTFLLHLVFPVHIFHR
ncbi:hypothetical protein RDWZM_000593, partial [Blomia tropicalis]